jgi:hypothetical protein
MMINVFKQSSRISVEKQTNCAGCVMEINVYSRQEMMSMNLPTTWQEQQ